MRERSKCTKLDVDGQTVHKFSSDHNRRPCFDVTMKTCRTPRRTKPDASSFTTTAAAPSRPGRYPACKPRRIPYSRSMSFIARAWAREPIVCFSIVVGAVGKFAHRPPAPYYTPTVVPCLVLSLTRSRVPSFLPSTLLSSIYPPYIMKGIAIPVFVAPRYGRNRDSVVHDERFASSNEAARAAFTREGPSALALDL
jgi:hypothetical protein